MSAAHWIGVNANHYLERYGATRDVLGWIAHSLGLGAPGETVDVDRLLARYDPGSIPRSAIDQPDLAPRGIRTTRDGHT